MRPGLRSSPLWRRRRLHPPTRPRAARATDLPTRWGGESLQGALDQGDVHPAVELVRRVADGADRLEAKPRVQLEARAVVGGDGGHDGAVTEAAGFVDQFGEERLADAATLMDRVDIHQVLDDVEATLVPGKEACPADDAALIRRHEELGLLAMRLPPVGSLLGVERFRVDRGEGLVHRPVVDPDDGAQVVMGGGPNVHCPGCLSHYSEIIARES